VCGADVETVQSLVEKSLVRRIGDRFWMLETIREYAAERLRGSGRAEDLRRWHFEFFLTLAESANLSEDVEGPMRFDLVLGEMDNFRAALDGASEQGEIELALRLAVALELIWSTLNVFEGIRRLTTLLKRATDVPAKLRARGLRTLCGPFQRSGDEVRAERAMRESLAIYRALGDEDGVAQLLHRLGMSAIYRGDRAAARSLFEESLELARRLGRRRIEALNIGGLGELEYREGRHESGLDLLQRSAGLAEEAGQVWWQSVMLGTLAEYGMELGRMDDAETWARQALELSSRMRDQINIVWGIANLAWSAADRGDGGRAGTLWGALEAEETRTPVGAWEEGERERYEAAVLDAAGPEFEHGRQRGRRLTLDEAISFALSDSPYRRD
jgi:tetratricopeptide (TPR) repeat protein